MLVGAGASVGCTDSRGKVPQDHFGRLAGAVVGVDLDYGVSRGQAAVLVWAWGALGWLWPAG